MIVKKNETLVVSNSYKKRPAECGGMINGDNSKKTNKTGEKR